MVDHFLPANAYTEELCRELAKHVSLSLMTSLFYQPKEVAWRCIRVFGNRNKTRRYYYSLFRLFLSAVFGGYDVIHLQDYKHDTMESFILKLARLTGKKLVCTAHNILPHEHNQNAHDENVMRRWYRACDAIIVHNEQTRQMLTTFEPACGNKIYVIAHGTYHACIDNVPKKEKDKTVFLQLGLIRKYKGIDCLLNAASLLPESVRKRIQIMIVGAQNKEVDDTDYEGMIASNSLEDFVEFRNVFVPDNEIPEFYGNADCCLFPYRDIYGSGALLMAYTFGKPVIVSNVPSFIEETDNGKTGILFTAGDAKSLANAIQRFTELPPDRRQSMVNTIHSLCEKKYNWAVSAKRLAQVYSALR